MTTKAETVKDGGAAYPCSNEQFTHGSPQTGDAWSGMALRDYFAAKIAGGMASYSGTTGAVFGPGDIAQRSYEVADAMIAERSKVGAAQ